MKDQIRQHIHDPEALESLYRRDKAAFARDFPEASREIDTELVKFWRIRLKNGEVLHQPPGLKKGLTEVAIISVILAFLVKLPVELLDLSPEEYFARNLPVILLAGLTAWFVLKNQITGWKQILTLALPVVALVVYLNLLPAVDADTTVLAKIHAPLFMAFIFALAYISFEFRNTKKVSGFLRYCGELITMSGLLAIAGAILSAVTIGLFEIIGMKIGEVYMQNVGVVGAAVIPVIAAWLIDLYPGITEKVVPVIARIFTPLVLLAAIIYLAAISFSGISLSANRDFLLVFNLLLIGVMAIVVFSLSEPDVSQVRKLNVILLFLLTVVTLLIDLFALAAIITRLLDGFTPNRTVVLLSNVLILIQLMLVLPALFRAGFWGKPLDRAECVIDRYLPVYFIYSAVVIFVFPWIF